MRYGLGIDTGGTYTDAVIFDFDTKKIVDKSKSLTTKENLSDGITASVSKLDIELLSRIRQISLSTTLATNACVENKGGRAKLVLVGSSYKILEMIGAEKKYGLLISDVLCIDAPGTINGREFTIPDWEKHYQENIEWFAQASALGIVEVYAMHNGGVVEHSGKDFFEKRCKIPIVLGNDFAHGLNVMERGATTLLNARLLPVIEEFASAVKSSLAQFGIDSVPMIVRSDGSLMCDTISRSRPVETILSGPAASVIGGSYLTGEKDCLVVDMGGTTTDISIITDGIPAMSDGIKIGGWNTQVRGVFTDTFGLGGDSRIILSGGGFSITSRKVMPYCTAATRWPEIKDYLRLLLSNETRNELPVHEFLCLVKEPSDLSKYSYHEQNLIETIKNGPVALGSDKFNLYNFRPERLEDEGIALRIGLTPTDIMHIRGDFQSFDAEASLLAAKYFVFSIFDYYEGANGLELFCEDVYNKVCEKLYINIVRVLAEYKFPDIYKQYGSNYLTDLAKKIWGLYNMPNKMQAGLITVVDFSVNFVTDFTLVGVGAPVHIFLKRVAEVIGTKAILPEHADVANAVGAAVADFRVVEEIEITPDISPEGISGYNIHDFEKLIIANTLDEAIETAKELALSEAKAKVRAMGALGELYEKLYIEHNCPKRNDGGEIYLGSVVKIVITGRNPNIN